LSLVSPEPNYSCEVRQRAFRQRKEQHVKLLEDKVAALEANQKRLGAENAELEEDLNKVLAENASLRDWSASNSPRDQSQSARGSVSSMSSMSSVSSVPNDEHVRFNSLPVVPGFEPQNIIASTEGQGRDVLYSKIWELILNHHLLQEGLADVKIGT
jgi:hypothetical protein